MFLTTFVRLSFAGMLLFLLMSGLASHAQLTPPATSVMVYQGWG
ncbi:MAG TPA: hypothetical protein VFK25_12085 [Candidatus Binatia bacterium]|nr:hypothetical protein [Candidatus Binatia bacterium]